jgi:DNA-binding transcriptional LysR family regulator
VQQQSQTLNCKEKIASDKLVVVAKHNHPKLMNGLDLSTFLSLGQVTVATQKNETSQVDVALDKLGKKRQVKLSGQHFLTVPSVIVKTDLVACLPYHLAKHYNVAVYDLPISVPAIEYFSHWHVSADEDSAHRWMREQISEVANAFKLR